MPQKAVKLEFVYCHRKPERSFFWRNKQFPVCARCTGIHIAYLVYPFFLFDVVRLNIWITLALAIPSLVDGLTQAYGNRESTNILRLITGLMAGLSIVSLASLTGEVIAHFILSLKK